ncbi:hypothetical protein [Methylocaldum marinum]|uniref:hypothetical protein n=1 Tax=Methylocaldum marinum TaxID=1432792 RepID=UPI000E69BDA6|nr:hypothetical protein [Methylocaldum marinum]
MGGHHAARLFVYQITACEKPHHGFVFLLSLQFTQRLPTPLFEDKLAVLLRQNIDVDLLTSGVCQHSCRISLCGF